MAINYSNSGSRKAAKEYQGMTENREDAAESCIPSPTTPKEIMVVAKRVRFNFIKFSCIGSLGGTVGRMFNWRVDTAALTIVVNRPWLLLGLSLDSDVLMVLATTRFSIINRNPSISGVNNAGCT